MAKMNHPQFIAAYGVETWLICAKRGAEKRMAIVDSLPAEWRSLVHDYDLREVLKLRNQRIPAWKALAILNPTPLDLDF